MREGHKMMTFYVTAEQSALMRAHRQLEGESGRNLIARLLSAYLAEPSSVRADKVPTARPTIVMARGTYVPPIRAGMPA